MYCYIFIKSNLVEFGFALLILFMAKIGRNDPCPCGSGLKYKRCCIDEPSSLPPLSRLTSFNHKSKGRQYKKYISNHNTTELLNLMTGTQLLPKNHGKNIRIEGICLEIIRRLNGKKEVSINEFKKLVSKELPFNSLEDPPENAYTENVIFHGGNYVAIPGISTDAAEVFRALSEVIFASKNTLPNQYLYEIYSAIGWVLELGQIIFNKASLKPYIFSENEDSEIEFPKEIIDYSFTQGEIRSLGEKHNFSYDVLKDFILDETDKEITNNNPDENPLILKPFFVYQSHIHFVTPSTQLGCLNDYILRKAIEMNCGEELHEIYNWRLWMDILERIYRMAWLGTNIELPESKTSLGCTEGVFHMDDNKLAYVIFIKAKIYGKSSGFNFTEEAMNYDRSDLLNNRISEVLSFLKSKKGLEDYQFLNLIIMGHAGRNIPLNFGRQDKGVEQVWFTVFDFLKLSKSEDWDILSIWKFARAYRLQTAKAMMSPWSMVDNYWLYKENNESFYVSDDVAPNYISITVGSGTELLRDAILKENLHCTPTFQDGVLGFRPVIRSFDFAPIYKPTLQIGRLERVLECFPFPLWMINEQDAAGVNSGVGLHFLNAIGFWLFKLKDHLKNWDIIGTQPFYLQVVLPNEFFEDGERKVSTHKEVVFEADYNTRVLTFIIPVGIEAYLNKPDNEGERILIKHLVGAFNKIDGVEIAESQIEEMVDVVIPFGPAKMLLFVDTSNNILIDPRWLIPVRNVSDANVSLILDIIPSFASKPIPKDIQSKEEKVELCNDIVGGLIKQLRDLLAEYSPFQLLDRLMLIHEGYIRKREYQKIEVPAKIACFEEHDKEVEKLQNESKLLAVSTVSVRCLIEFIAADPVVGTKPPNFDDIDHMLATMYQIVDFGFLSDTIHLGFDNPEMGILPSERLGITKGRHHENLQAFGKAKAYSDIQTYQQNFEKSYNKEIKKNEGEPPPLSIKLNTAFETDWGISLTKLISILQTCAMIAERNEKSVMALSAEELRKALQQHLNLNDEEVSIGLKRLSLTKRKKFEQAPIGYHQNDIYPWKYNRELSLLRRPLVLINEDNKDYYYWGLRSAYAAIDQLFSLIFSGRLKCKNEPHINSLLRSITQENGKAFRNLVADWLKTQESLTTIDYEVSIKPKGHIEADVDLGDIDILSFDEKKNIVYLLECKDTDQPRNIHEMKGELDKYLGRHHQEGLIQKHVKRYEYLKNHKSQLASLLNVGSPDELILAAIIITSEDLPLAYFRNELALPFVSFPGLQRLGLNCLVQTIKESE